MPKTTPPERDPEDLYASLNWEDNPPINGFYEMMMSLTRNGGRNCADKAPGSRKLRNSGNGRRYAPDGSPERQTETSRRYAENGQLVRHVGKSGGGRTR